MQMGQFIQHQVIQIMETCYHYPGATPLNSAFSFFDTPDMMNLGCLTYVLTLTCLLSTACSIEHSKGKQKKMQNEDMKSGHRACMSLQYAILQYGNSHRSSFNHEATTLVHKNRPSEQVLSRMSPLSCILYCVGVLFLCNLVLCLLNDFHTFFKNVTHHGRMKFTYPPPTKTRSVRLRNGSSSLSHCPSASLTSVHTMPCCSPKKKRSDPSPAFSRVVVL